MEGELLERVLERSEVDLVSISLSFVLCEKVLHQAFDLIVSEGHLGVLCNVLPHKRLSDILCKHSCPLILHPQVPVLVS